MEKITCKVHLTSQVEVGAGTVAEFMNNYLAENGRTISIIRQLSINGSVQFLGIPDSSGEVHCSLLKPCNPLMSSQAGDTVIPSIRTGELDQGDLTTISQSLGVLPFLPAQITCIGFWLTCAMLRVASMTTYFVVDVEIV